ncbi:MAG: hypothetical protein R3A48_14695 [Polyangiales bacterium]
MRRALLTLCLSACTPVTVSTTFDGGADAPSIPQDAVEGGSSNQVDVAAGADVPLPPGEPPWVEVDVRTGGPCDPVTACGGEVEATWDVAGACIEVPLDETLMRCPGASVTRRGGRARGRVTFGSRVARRSAEWSAEVETMIPAVCASFVGGCEAIQSAARLAVPDTTCETLASGACRCLARQSGRIDDGDGYVTERGQIVSSSLGRRWDYCVQGDLLRYRDVSATGPREPGTITLRRR